MLQPIETTAPPATDLVDRARALVPVLRERAGRVDRERAVPVETVADIRSAGLFRIFQPARFGGQEREFIDGIDIIFELARGCASTAWIFAVISSFPITLAGLSLETQAELWSADPNALGATTGPPYGKAVRVEGGYRLSGRWPFASGSDHADWVLVGGRVEDGAASISYAVFLVPRTAFETVDDWHVLGLAGTGSRTLVTTDLFLPADRMFDGSTIVSGRRAGAASFASTIYRVPTYASIPWTLVAVAVGTAQAMVEHFVAYVGGKISRGANVSEQAAIQSRVAQAQAEIDAARMVMRHNVVSNTEELRATGHLSIESRARNRRDHGFVTDLCVKATDSLFVAAGAHALFLDNPLQRCFRDVHAAAQQRALNSDSNGGFYGMFRLGVPLDPATL